MSTAVVLLNWNGRHWLERFLPEVVVNTAAHAEIWVVDNASTDDSRDWTQRHFPEVRWLQNTENAGYSGGYNWALAHIPSEIVVLMNTDVLPRPGWLEPLEQALDKNDQLGAVQPKILDQAHPDRFEYAGAAGGFMDRLGYAFCRGRMFDTLEMDSGQFDVPGPVFWASGACIALKRRAYLEIGGLEPHFFAHFEEIDLCWRLHRAGYEVAYCGESVVEHVGGGTLGQLNPHKTYLNFRNNLLCLSRNLPLAQLLWLIPVRLVLDGLAACQLWVSKGFAHFWAVVRAHRGYYASLSKVAQFRRSDPYPRSWPSTGLFPGSVLWHYYLLGHKHFDRLNWNPNKPSLGPRR
ncbi:glycosyltransferase [bacterium]|nr:glycosyltransferase [bacterium]